LSRSAGFVATKVIAEIVTRGLTEGQLAGRFVWGTRSVLDLPYEGRSNCRALERIGIALAGVVDFHVAADKSPIELGSFGFAELMPDGFPSGYHRVGKDSGK
jgi:hypothetical protein